MLRFLLGGSFDTTDKFLNSVMRDNFMSNLDALGRKGVEALRQSTPRDSGATADAWSYEIQVDAKGVIIRWNNSNIVDGFNVAVGLQYGHGTGNGGYIQGRDYINPAIQPIFDEIANSVWKGVQSA